MGDAEHVAGGYRRFATEEAGRSPLYAEWAAGVAADPEILSWLAGLPRGKRQPNLLFASLRLLAGTPPSFAAFRDVLLARRPEIEAEILARRTQTNEPARCALLLPALAALPQPLALLEVGASAGLCLLPDRYAYDYAGHRVGNGGPLLRCRPEGDVPLPRELPRVVWRAGLDLAPVDVHDPGATRWLELLVWPGEEYRLEHLRGALAVARKDPPRVVRGDLLTDLPALAAEAPGDATLVVFHTAVLAYVPSAGRVAFAEAVRSLDAVWLANEAPGVLGLKGRGPALASGPPPQAPFNMALARDGEVIAWTDGHGVGMRWL
jgi:Uncharacterized protein conserved in bacteria (DUF2332)